MKRALRTLIVLMVVASTAWGAEWKQVAEEKETREALDALGFELITTLIKSDPAHCDSQALRIRIRMYCLNEFLNLNETLPAELRQVAGIPSYYGALNPKLNHPETLKNLDALIAPFALTKSEDCRLKMESTLAHAQVAYRKILELQSDVGDANAFSSSSTDAAHPGVILLGRDKRTTCATIVDQEPQN